MAKVFILCGKIASGKTYYANELKEQKKAILLSVDDLMLKLSDSCLGEHHDDMASRCEHFFYGLAEQVVKNGTDVIIDFGYWSKKEREEAKEYFTNRGVSSELHYIRTSEEIRLLQLERRNAKLTEGLTKESGRVYIIDEALRRRLDQKFEEPLETEVEVLISRS
jgi:predicted kinase